MRGSLIRWCALAICLLHCLGCKTTSPTSVKQQNEADNGGLAASSEPVTPVANEPSRQAVTTLHSGSTLLDSPRETSSSIPPSVLLASYPVGATEANPESASDITIAEIADEPEEASGGIESEVHALPDPLTIDSDPAVGQDDATDYYRRETFDDDDSETPTVVETGVAKLSIAEAVRVALTGNKSIMVLGYVPQEQGTEISLERAVFDPVFEANVRGGKFDRQLANFIDSGGLVPANEQQSDFVGASDDNILSISKLMETGGVVELGLGTDYLFLTPPGTFVIQNPAWRSAINFRFIQPLMRGAGREVTTAPLRIAQAGRDQASHQFQSTINAILRDVRLAYWDWVLASREWNVRRDAVRQAMKTVENVEAALRLGESTDPDVQQARDQLHRFRIDAARSKNDFLQSRIELSRLMGIPGSRATFDLAADYPTLDVPSEREEGEATALLRPEIMARRAQIRAAEIEVRVACNNLRPDLGLRFDYAITGLEDRLDDSFDTTFDARYNDWLVQLDYRRAAGLRAEYALLRQARLRLARARAEQELEEHNILAEVGSSWENLQIQISTLQYARQRVDTAAEFVKGRDELYREGEGSLDQKVRAEQTLVDAQLAEVAAEIAVEQAIVDWEFATGQQSYVQFADDQPL